MHESCHVRLHACHAYVQLSQMIETAWAWAAQHGKLEKNLINGAEYAYLVVDQFRQKLSERSQSMVATASAQIEAGKRSTATDCMWTYVLVAGHDWKHLGPHGGK